VGRARVDGKAGEAVDEIGALRHLVLEAAIPLGREEGGDEVDFETRGTRAQLIDELRDRSRLRKDDPDRMGQI
jgi:hypothetical protein